MPVPYQDVHWIQIDVEDLELMDFGEHPRSLDRNPEMGHEPVRRRVLADRRRQRKLVEQRRDQVATSAGERAVVVNEREMARTRQLTVDRGETADLVVQVVLVQPGRTLP